MQSKAASLSLGQRNGIVLTWSQGAAAKKTWMQGILLRGEVGQRPIFAPPEARQTTPQTAETQVSCLWSSIASTGHMFKQTNLKMRGIIKDKICFDNFGALVFGELIEHAKQFRS